MKNFFLFTTTIMLSFLSLQSCYSQSNYCPANIEEAKNGLFKYFETEEQIKSIEQLLGIELEENPKERIRPLTDEKDKNVCMALKSKLEWMSNYKTYSFFTLNDFYFIVLYTFNKENDFNLIEIPIINSEYEAIGSFINND